MFSLRTLSILSALITISITSFCFADETGKSGINWNDGFIEATGQGTAKASGNKGKDRINSKRAAEVAAQRALLETIKGLHITSMTTVEDSMLKEDIIKTKVDGVIKGAHVIADKFEWEGNSPVSTVVMRICLNGSLICKGPTLVNALDLEKKVEPAFVPQKMLLATPVTIPPAPPTPKTYKYDLNKPVTGVVFAIAGRNFERSLLPVVVTQSNAELLTVYSAKVVKPSVIRTFGAIRYADSVENAMKNPQLGDNVMVLPAVDITKENMIVIDTRDAATLKETLAHGNDYLAEAKVVISVK
ncbi:MAG: hypothetical protein WCP33_04440 [Deltaproteobacteria bacterium]